LISTIRFFDKIELFFVILQNGKPHFFNNLNYNINCEILLNYQLILSMDIGVNIPESLPIRVIIKLLEGLDYRN